jgi:cell division protein ZapA (FtsZ GTPase activity inhibitor)
MQTQVTIRGKVYRMRSDVDGIDIEAAARMVEARMAEISRRSASADEYTVALMAALNIASELDQFRKDVDVELEDLDRELARTAVMIEAVLPSTPEPSAGR